MRKETKKLREDLQAVVDLCLEDFGLPSFPVKVKPVQRGRCNKKTITLPAYLYYHHEAYKIYYAVHEAVHKIRGGGHSPVFKRTEDELLKKFGIKIKRKKAYPGSLWLDGVPIYKNNVYTKHGERERLKSLPKKEQKILK
jgi:hypothetical protein